jgi:hypothetical protein
MCAAVASSHRISRLGNTFIPVEASRASWDAFSAVDAFADEVLAELTAMRADDTKSTRPRLTPPLTGLSFGQADCGAQRPGSSLLLHKSLPPTEGST